MRASCARGTPPSGTVVAAFRERARAVPDAVALAGEGTSLSYRELDERSEQLARWLAARIEPEEAVGVKAGRAGETVIALLGVLKAGGAYLPIDPDYPPERQRHILGDGGCRVVLEPASWREAGGDGLGPSPPAPAPGQLAYILYTSGSTGLPKGVAVEHRSLDNVVRDHIQAFAATGADRILLFSSPAFDAYLFQVFVGLAVGAALVPLPSAVLGDRQAFLDFLVRHEISILSVPPAYLNTLGRVPLGPVRLINTGGDASIPGDALYHAGRLRYLSTYGPTETTICAAVHEVDPALAYPRGVPLGRAITGVSLFVLDEELAPVPPGEEGEICIGGAGLARHLLHRPAATAERFVPHPFAPGERLYRTGDRGRFTADGTLEMTGRMDRQVKIRGHRIEPAEVEGALASHPAVAKAVVLALGRDARERHLVAFAVTAAPQDELRRHLAARLPPAALPRRIVRLAELPLTVHGKVDTAALAAALDSAPAPPIEEDGALSAAERAVAALWEEVLGSPAAPAESFLDAGGDSLLAARLVAELRSRLRLEVGPAELLGGATVASLAARLSHAAAAGESPREPGGEPVASHAQRRLWFLEQITDHPEAYHLAETFAIQEPLDPGALLAALASVIGRHPTFRSRFAPGDGRLTLSPGAGFTPLLADLSALRDGAAVAERLAADLRRRPFDLAVGPLVRALLVAVGADRHLLALAVHHIVCDGPSLGILLAEVADRYAALRSGTTAPLPPAGDAALRYGLRQQALPTAPAREYWLARLAGAPPLDLPLHRPRPREQSFSGETVVGAVAPAVAGRLHELARAGRATLFMAVVAWVKALLARYTGDRDITVGAPMSDRRELGMGDAVGFFVNTVALRDPVAPERPFADLLAAVRLTCLEALRHQAYPFDRIVEELALPRDPSRPPLFDVMVALQEDDVRLVLPGVSVERRPPGATGSKLALSFDFVAGDAGLAVFLEVSTALFEPARMAAAIGHLGALAEGIVAEPDRPLAEIPLLSAAERAELAAWNGRSEAGAPATPATLTALFARAAARDPDHLALAAEGGSLTYGELDTASRALAHRLAEAGVRPGGRVALLAGRAPRFFVAVLAVLRAGAAYVPIDPAAPPQRIGEILTRAGCSVVLADPALAGHLPEGCPVLELGEPAAAAPAALPPGPPSPESLAYCIFTSGSTGQPKGVAVSHRSAATAVDMWARDYGLGRPVVLQLAAFSFDVSVGDFCRSLLAGGTLVVATAAERLDPAAVVGLVERHGVTCFETTPALARLLARHLERRGRSMPALRLLVVGSDLWHLDELRALSAVLAPATRLINSYGTTETTIDSAFFDAASIVAASAASHTVPIGRPMTHVEMGVANEADLPAPVGVAGEIWIAGAGLSQGYLDDPAQTADRFRPHPERSGERRYRTGDLGRWSPAGQLEILGRLDRQAKVRGYRIELGEVEGALESHPAVEAAVAAVVEIDGAGELAAWIVGSAPAGGEEELARHAGERLPPYAVPTAWSFLPLLPTTASGKIDRKALPLPRRMRRPQAGRAPATPMEKLLAELFQAALPPAGAPPDAETSFFLQGGDSIRAISLALDARSRGLALSALDLFRHPSIAELARHLEGGERPAGPPPVPRDLAAVSREVAARLAVDPPHLDLYPALALQQTMLAASRAFAAAEGIYHGQTTWRVRAPEAAPLALVRAIRLTAARHPALATALIEDAGGTLYQVVRPPEEVDIELCDLTALPPAAAARAVARYLDDDRLAGFLPGRPLQRFAVFAQAAGVLELVASAHHAVDDGWSTAVFEREVFDGCLRICRGEPWAPEPAPDVPRQAAALEQESRRSKDQRAFWERELADWPAPPLAHRFPGTPGGRRFGSGRHSLDRLAVQMPAGRAPAKALALAALLEALEHELGPSFATAGVVTNGRSERLSDPLGALGLYWSLLPVARPAAAADPAAVLAATLQRLEPFARSFVPFLVDEGRGFPFFALFNYVDLHNRRPLPPPLEPLGESLTEPFPFPLTAAVALDAAGGGTLHLQHDRLLISDAEAARLGERLAAALAGGGA